MDEIIELLTEIRDYLACIDSEISDIKYECQQINSAASDINGKGLYSLEDIAEKLDGIDNSIETLSDKIG